MSYPISWGVGIRGLTPTRLVAQCTNQSAATTFSTGDFCTLDIRQSRVEVYTPGPGSIFESVDVAAAFGANQKTQQHVTGCIYIGEGDLAVGETGSFLFFGVTKAMVVNPDGGATAAGEGRPCIQSQATASTLQVLNTTTRFQNGSLIFATTLEDMDTVANGGTGATRDLIDVLFNGWGWGNYGGTIPSIATDATVATLIDELETAGFIISQTGD